MPLLSFDSNLAPHRHKSIPPASNPALPLFDFEAESPVSTLDIPSDDKMEKGSAAPQGARKSRKSIFDVLENSTFISGI